MMPSRCGSLRRTTHKGATRMESAPAFFAGMVFALFGAGLLLWSARCVMRNVPVAQHAGPVAAVFVTACGAISLLVGVWCFLRV